MFGRKEVICSKCSNPVDLNEKGPPRKLTDEDVNDWLNATDEREPEWVGEMEAILRDWWPKQRVKVWTIRRDLADLRHEAFIRGLSWGQLKKKGVK